MEKFLNSGWWVRDLTIFEVLIGGVFDHLNCHHNREI